jgi:hypothetical protein
MPNWCDLNIMTNNEHCYQKKEYHKWTGPIILAIWMVPGTFVCLSFIYAEYSLQQYDIKDRIILRFTDEGREKLSYHKISAIGGVACMLCTFVFILIATLKPRLLLKKGRWKIKEHFIFLIYSTILSALALLHSLYGNW